MDYFGELPLRLILMTKVTDMLYEESKAFTWDDDDTGCIPSLHMSITLLSPLFLNHCIRKSRNTFRICWQGDGLSYPSALCCISCVSLQEGGHTPTLHRLLNQKTIPGRHPLPCTEDLGIWGYQWKHIRASPKAFNLKTLFCGVTLVWSNFIELLIKEDF